MSAASQFSVTPSAPPQISPLPVPPKSGASDKALGDLRHHPAVKAGLRCLFPKSIEDSDRALKQLIKIGHRACGAFVDKLPPDLIESLVHDVVQSCVGKPADEVETSLRFIGKRCRDRMLDFRRGLWCPPAQEFNENGERNSWVPTRRGLIDEAIPFSKLQTIVGATEDCDDGNTELDALAVLAGRDTSPRDFDDVRRDWMAWMLTNRERLIAEADEKTFAAGFAILTSPAVAEAIDSDREIDAAATRALERRFNIKPRAARNLKKRVYATVNKAAETRSYLWSRVRDGLSQATSEQTISFVNHIGKGRGSRRSVTKFVIRKGEQS